MMALELTLTISSNTQVNMAKGLESMELDVHKERSTQAGTMAPWLMLVLPSVKMERATGLVVSGKRAIKSRSLIPLRMALFYAVDQQLREENFLVLLISSLAINKRSKITKKDKVYTKSIKMARMRPMILMETSLRVTVKVLTATLSQHTMDLVRHSSTITWEFMKKDGTQSKAEVSSSESIQTLRSISQRTLTSINLHTKTRTLKNIRMLYS